MNQGVVEVDGRDAHSLRERLAILTEEREAYAQMLYEVQRNLIAQTGYANRHDAFLQTVREIYARDSKTLSGRVNWILVPTLRRLRRALIRHGVVSR